MQYPVQQLLERHAAQRFAAQVLQQVIVFAWRAIEALPPFGEDRRDRRPARSSGSRELYFRMIAFTPELRDLEAAYQREAFADLSYQEALARFAALWAEACELQPDIGADWRADLAPDLAIARAVNGLSPIP